MQGNPAESWEEGVRRRIKELEEEVERLKGTRLEATERADRLTGHLETNPVVIYSCGSGPDFPVTYISGNIQSHFGHHPADFYADPHFWENLIHPEDRGVIPGAYEAVNAKQVFHCEYRVRHRAGHFVWVLDHIGPRFDPEGAVVGLCGSWTDITVRVVREQKLRRREALTRAIIENVPCGVFRILPDGTILSSNPALVRMFGFDTEEEILAVSAESLYFDPGQRPELWDRCRREGSYTNVETKMKRKDGTPFWALICTHAVTDEEGEVVSLDGIISDVTELHEARAELREREAQLELTIEVANLAYWEQDFKSGRVTRSKRWAEMLGYSPEEVSSRLESWLDLIHPDDLPRVQQAAAVHEAGDSPVFEVEHRMHTRSGQWKWILNWGRIVERDEEGRPVRGIGMHLDVSARRNAEEALKEKEARIRAIFETIPDPIFIKDCQLRYVRVNPAMEVLLGLGADDIVGKTDPDLLGAGKGEELEAMDRRILTGQSMEWEESRPFQDPDRVFHVVKVPLRDDRDTIMGICGIARDITEVKMLQSLAARAQRLETAGRIAGQVAHDFNNLLGPLAGYPGLIRQQLPAGHPAGEFIDYMETAASQMAEINQQLLTLGRRGHYNMDVLCINTLVREAAGQIVSVPAGVRIELDLAKDLFDVKAGRSQIFRVIYNLLVNARDAVGEMGLITIRTENVYADTTCGHIDRIPRGEYVKLAVMDTGTGMTSEVMAKMFDPFFTTKTTDKKRGSGLGLSVVHAVVNDHHGYIDCKSKPGKGTSIFLYLPSTREVPVESSSQIVGGTETILVIDDDRLQREVTAQLLGRLGYTVTRVASGEEALDELARERHDLLILDMIMPGGIDGLETFRRIKRIRPDQQAILVSGFAESKRVEEAMQLGAGRFLRKPLTLQVLSTAVRDELDHLRLRMESARVSDQRSPE